MTRIYGGERLRFVYFKTTRVQHLNEKSIWFGVGESKNKSRKNDFVCPPRTLFMSLLNVSISFAHEKSSSTPFWDFLLLSNKSSLIVVLISKKKFTSFQVEAECVVIRDVSAAGFFSKWNIRVWLHNLKEFRLSCRRFTTVTFFSSFSVSRDTKWVELGRGELFSSCDKFEMIFVIFPHIHCRLSCNVISTICELCEQFSFSS